MRLKTKMLEFKKFQVRPSGHITGGSMQYNFDTATGDLTWNASVDVSFLFMSKTLTESGVQKIDPSALLSKNFQVGQVLKIGPVEMRPASIENDKASGELTVALDNGAQFTGSAVFDVSGPYAILNSLDETGTVEGFSIELIVD